MPLEFLRNGIEKFLTARWRDSSVKRNCQTVKLGNGPNPCGQRSSEDLYFQSAQGQTMIRGRTGHTGRGLNHIQAIHLAAKAIDYRELIQIAAARKFPDVANVSRPAAQEIGIEREDDFGLFDTINRIEITPESELRTLARAVADRRLPLVPFGFRKKGQQRLNLSGKRRRSDNSGQDAETRAVRAFHLRRECLRAFHKQRPRLDFPKFRDRLRAIRIVKIQDRCLRKHVCRTKAGWMVGIAFDFGWSPLVAFHEQADRVRSKRHGRGIKLRLAESQSIGLLDVRHNILLWS